MKWVAVLVKFPLKSLSFAVEVECRTGSSVKPVYFKGQDVWVGHAWAESTL